jgi:predicted transposase/invertase (TIGR01784 family)
VEVELAESELLSPRIDIVFKMLFGQEGNEDLLLSLLNAVLQRPTGKHIVEVTLLNPALEREYPLEKGSILDLKARDERGTLYDVEMQCENHKLFAERLLYYWARLYSSQLKEGQIYEKLHPVVSVVFTDFALRKETKKYHTCWMWREVQEGWLFNESASSPISSEHPNLPTLQILKILSIFPFFPRAARPSSFSSLELAAG